MKRVLLIALTTLGCASTVSPDGRASQDSGTMQDAGASRADGAIADVPMIGRDAETSPDVIRAISDDCARGTWCWERPVPTGERAVGARALERNRLVYVTRGGTVARWDGSRWRTAPLALPAPVTSFWAERDDTIFLTCQTEDTPGATPRRWLARVDGERATVLAGPEDGTASGLVGTSPTDLWAVAGRSLLRWDGTRLAEIPAPGGALIVGLHAVVPGEVIALESWGSGSGYGILHRVRDGAWSTLTDFRSLRARVDGPIVAAEGALWLRAWDAARSVTEIAHVDPMSGVAELVTPPTDDSGLRLHAVGNHLWATSGTRGWDRGDARWDRVPELPGGWAPVFAGTSSADVWFLGDIVARRATDGWRAVDGGSAVGSGRSWGEAMQPVAGFWRDENPTPALVTTEVGALAVQSDIDRARWPLRYFPWRQPFRGWAPDGRDGGWISDATTVYRVIGRVPAERVAWPAGVLRAGSFGAWDGSLWIASARGVERYRGGRWLDPVPVPTIAEAPGQTPVVTSVHGVADDTALVATTLVTGDKRVFVRVYALRGGAATELVALRGEFGRSEEVLVAGALPSVWIAYDGLRRWDGAQVRTVETSVTPTDLHALADGRAVGTDGARVYAWSADGARTRTLDVPRASELTFRYVRAGTDGTLRVAAPGGQVLRYSP